MYRIHVMDDRFGQRRRCNIHLKISILQTGYTFSHLLTQMYHGSFRVNTGICPAIHFSTI
jgi:hypothetical protein